MLASKLLGSRIRPRAEKEETDRLECSTVSEDQNTVNAGHQAPQSARSKPRPRALRALGKSEPPLLVQVDGQRFARKEIFKHDSWAATALYESESGRRIVCKFNRQASIGPVPMRWLGRWLARRESYFLGRLSDVPGIPRAYEQVKVNDRPLTNAVAHDYVPGHPLSLSSSLPKDFFERVERMLSTLHSRRIIYVDLHKQENVLVGDDGLPYLIDFQVSVQLPTGKLWGPLFGALRDCDLYHLDKHRWIHRMPPASMKSFPRPAWVTIASPGRVPLRSLRRRLLVAIGVRRGRGSALTEVAPEVGLRRADAA